MNKVIVVPYNPNWVKQYEGASLEIKAALGINLVDIHHIGSTSIPGIYAKPIIDMLVVVNDLLLLDKDSCHMEDLGYEARGEFGIEGRRYFPRNNAVGERTHQVHAFQAGSTHIHRHLVFRDYMRSHPAAAHDYAVLKRRLAEAHPYDLNAYMDGKDAFIQNMDIKALAWDAAGRVKPL